MSPTRKRVPISQPIQPGLEPGAWVTTSAGAEPAGCVPLGVIRLVFFGLVMTQEDRTCTAVRGHPPEVCGWDRDCCVGLFGVV